MPQTSSAVAVWLVKLDELIAPHLGRVQAQNKLEIVRRLEGMLVFEKALLLYFFLILLTNARFYVYMVSFI